MQAQRQTIVEQLLRFDRARPAARAFSRYPHAAQPELALCRLHIRETDCRVATRLATAEMASPSRGAEPPAPAGKAAPALTSCRSTPIRQIHPGVVHHEHFTPNVAGTAGRHAARSAAAAAARGT